MKKFLVLALMGLSTAAISSELAPDRQTAVIQSGGNLSPQQQQERRNRVQNFIEICKKQTGVDFSSQADQLVTGTIGNFNFNRGGEISEDVIRAIVDLNWLTELSISVDNPPKTNRQINPKGIQYLAESLRDNHVLKELSLSHSNPSLGLNSDDAKYLAEAIKVNRSLVKLDLYHNNIKDDGFTSLLASLKENNHIKYLNVESNNITSSTISA